MALAQTQFDVFAFSTLTSLPVDGDAANITAKLRKDGSAWSVITDTNPSPIAGEPGFYRFDLTESERDVSLELRIFPTSSTSGVQVIGVPMFFMAGSGGGSSVNVLPAVGISADRSPGVTLKAFVGETITQAITLYETDGTTPIVLTGKTLVLVFETRQGVDVATVASGDITIGGDDDNVISFSYPSAATASERVLKFALRDAGSPNTVDLQGLLSVQRAPKVD